VSLEFVRLTRAAGDRHEIAAALTQFDCCRGVTDDPVAHEVNAFIRTDEWRAGADLGVNTTYLFFDSERDSGDRIVGYVALAVDTVKLSSGERDRLGRTNFPGFGALRLVMIGVDSDYQSQGVGDELLRWVVGKGRAMAEEVAFRFVLADVNLRRKGWYDGRQFQVNRASIYKPDDPGRSTVSMRLDLRGI
jgi:ribosomal protein S18 acetylase RimI-like enzyme